MPLSDYFTSPTSFQGRQFLGALVARDQTPILDNAIEILKSSAPRHSGHPNFGHLTLLVFEAVLEVVCVSLPGYIVARQGMFDAESQKFLANLNVMLFTPCLIFQKLASQLTAEKLADLAIIPVIFIVQTTVAYIGARIIARFCGFKKRQENFLIAMGVFGNSNSLPISLVLALSKTLKGLHWDKVPHDNDDEVAARGILYLLVFQQLGQLLRWSWGYNVLLAPPEAYTVAEGGTKQIDEAERGRGEYRDEVDSDREQTRLISPDFEGDRDSSDDFEEYEDDRTQVGTESPTASKSDGHKTPRNKASAKSSRNSSQRNLNGSAGAPDLMPTPTNGMVAPHHSPDYPAWLKAPENQKYDEDCGGIKGKVNKARNIARYHIFHVGHVIRSNSQAAFAKLPAPVQKVMTVVWNRIYRFFAGLWEFMNPPLWAMLIAIVVASIPRLQHLFYDNGTFVRNSVTRAIDQSGAVAVPLILVVLGGNLAKNTVPKETVGAIADPQEERKLLYASLIARMVLPTLIMAPILAVIAKYVPVSIVDDKIFVIVAFLLAGAPVALQIGQITTQNNVYPGLMSRILFQSYVVWILPSTLILVLLALETVEWATM
ncbi:auxin efflux carrier [Exophiala viscosa]|uniref:Auxin efflux carrier n=1 Tax=Exophiala viscosa TaxID=2486360 RepID=A0AAN6IES1_9EURO|nr:auxin efflux carrier [Exophiala viscosa]KAI1624251.1 auxin efflux carrier [Exophiala viscosa]